MNDEQFRKIKLNRTLYSAKRIGSSEPEYFLDYKITTVRYLPTDEHYDIVREMFEICDTDPDNVVNWYNKKLLKNVQNRLEAWDKDDISINMIQYERLIKCKNETRDFLMERGIKIEKESIDILVHEKSSTEVEIKIATKDSCLSLCKNLLDSKFTMTRDDKDLEKHKTFSKYRKDFMNNSKNDMYKNFNVIMNELEKQKFISYHKFEKIINAPSDYYYKVLLNSFIQSCNIKNRAFSESVVNKKLKVIDGSQGKEMGLRLTGKL